MSFLGCSAAYCWSIFTGIAILGLATFLWYWNENESKKHIKYDEIIDLLIEEESILLYTFSISSITFYSGDLPQNQIRSRLIAIFKANPWLASRLLYLDTSHHHHHKKAHLKAVYKKEFPEVEIDQYYKEMMIDPITDWKGLSTINENIPHETMTKLLRSELVKLGIYCIGKPNEPLIKFRILKFLKKGETIVEKSAIVYSFSHTLGDGETFFRIFSFLDENKLIIPLISKRIINFPKQIDQVCGKLHQQYLASYLFQWIIIYYRYFSSKVDIHVYTIDMNKIEELKQTFRAQRTPPTSKKMTDAFKEEFISTNDILTSWFFTNMKNEYGIMALNYRNRLIDYTEDHAGNYEGFVIYHHDEFQTPCQIREVIENPRLPKLDRIPTVIESLRMNIGFITNLSGFYHNTANFMNCECTGHFPLLDQSDALLKDFMLFSIQTQLQNQQNLLYGW